MSSSAPTSDVAPDATAANAAAPMNPEESTIAGLMREIKALTDNNEAMQQKLQTLIKQNEHELDKKISDTIQPWLTALDIPAENQKSFIEGLIASCSQAQLNKGQPLDENPSYLLACAAAAHHGRQIKELEDTRSKLEAAETRAAAAQAAHEQSAKREAANERDLLFASTAARAESTLGKRPAESMSSTQDPQNEMTACWSNIFESMTSRG